MAYVNVGGGYVDYAYQDQLRKAQAAADAKKLADATASGTAAGTALKAASTASGVPLAGAPAASSSASSAGVTKVAPLGSGGGSLGGLQAVGGVGGGGSVGSVGGVAPVDTSAKNAAIFGAAKDQAGQTARASITGLRDELASRGMMGSGAEVAGTEDAIMKAQAGINSVTRQSAVTDADEAQKNATTNYEGSITQRGQDITANQNATSAALQGRAQDITMRGQDISSQQAAVAQQQQSLSALISAMGSLY